MRTSIRVLFTGVVAVSLLAFSVASAADPKSKTNATKAKEKVTEAVKTVNEDINESILNTKIRMTLLKSLKGADALRVGVKVQGTSALLSGEVEDRASVKVASEAAKSIEGVTDVRSSITHNPKAPHQGDFEAKVKDAVLVAQVRLGLLQEVGKSAVGIHVTATDGVVSLRGELANQKDRYDAVEKVKAMSNVKRVEDLTTVTL